MFLHCDLIIISFIQDGNTFCTTLNPRLFTMDLTIVEHKVFFTEVSLNNLFCGKIMITPKGSSATLRLSFLQLVCQLLQHDKKQTLVGCIFTDGVCYRAQWLMQLVTHLTLMDWAMNN